jgi:hypothetical protein
MKNTDAVGKSVSYGAAQNVPTPNPATQPRPTREHPMPTATETARLLTSAEGAGVFRVDVRIVTRWADDGRLTSIRTYGWHRRLGADEILAVPAGTRIDRHPSQF